MKSFIKMGLALYISIVFVQSLFFKFSGAPETVHIFGILAEWSGIHWFGEYGAYMVGGVELIASLLLLLGNRMLGALAAFGTMAGAVYFHLFTPLGIHMPEFDAAGNVVGNDGGLLFINACAILVASAVIIVMELSDSQEV